MVPLEFVCVQGSLGPVLCEGGRKGGLGVGGCSEMRFVVLL